MFDYIWDVKKEELNIKKHGVGFTVAIECFSDMDSLKALDVSNSKWEMRYKVLGKSSFGVLLVIYTERTGKKIRIISARPANKKERSIYEKNKN